MEPGKTKLRHLLRFGKRTVRACIDVFRADRNSFLRKASGVIHVGANAGQERAIYAKHDLDVIWIEPIPDVFLQLERNLGGFSKQRAYQYLITDKDNEKYTFHVANNNGASSSILELNAHKELWPTVSYQASIVLQSLTLASFVKKEGLDINEYDVLIIDTQGTELLVLKGAESLLGAFEYIQIEAPDFESYFGCCQIQDIEGFLEKHGFREWRRNKFASKQGVGSYYNIIYRKWV